MVQKKLAVSAGNREGQLGDRGLFQDVSIFYENSTFFLVDP